MQSPDLPNEQPLWPPPKAPLSTQRLASIANALGIPVPAVPAPFTRAPSESGLRTTSATTSIPSCSKYLLHVIPPRFLNRGSGKRSHRPPPPSANGYHPQFCRGVLVPVCANFQTQLALIAKEYALPNTTGMLLYLVTSLNDPPDTATTTRNEQTNEPGPLLSEDIWKHLWTRVIRAEQMEDNILPQSTPLYRLGSQSQSEVDQSISSSQRDGFSSQLRPFISAGTSRSRSVASSFSPSSNASSTSDLRLNSKSPFMTSSSDPSTPNTSQSSMDEAAIKADRLLLPGLGSPSLIPILAKVEFDIDHRKAGWLEPWLRSRRINHAKRFKVKHDGSREPPLAFVAGTKVSIDQEDVDDTSLSDDSDSEVGSDAGNATARVSLCTAANGPIEDMFGTNAGTAAEMCGRRSHGNEKDPKLLKKASHSQLSVIISSQESPKNLSDGVNAVEDEHDVYASVRSPEESEKRVGTFFADVDLGLDPSVEFDDNDPYDKRRSQFLMKAKLDEIEKAMLECSPRALKTSSEEDPAIVRQSPGKTTYLTVSPSRNGGPRRGQPHHNDNLEIATPAWSSVPHNSSREPVPIKSGDSVAPPRLALNGIATAGTSTVSISPLIRDTNRLKEDHSQTIVIDPRDAALSPDPFGPIPSPVVEEIPHGGIGNQAHPPAMTISSRFSLDSADEVAPRSSNRATLMSMKGITKFLRRSDKSSQSNNQLPQVPSTGRLSSNQLPPTHERPSKEDFLYMPDATSPVAVGQLSVPSSTPSSRSPSPNFVGPSNLEGLHFDQQSPYTTRFPSSQPTSPPLPPPPESQPQKAIKKSILKWPKARNGSVSQSASAADSRASMEQSRPPSRSGIVEGLRARQSSIVGLVFNKHVPASPTDIPPSPRVPEQFTVKSRHATPLPTTASVAPQGQPPSDTNLPRSSTDSRASSEHRTSSPSRGSVASSQDSLYTRPSFDDTSQFEIVSPKTTALIYPYHGLDHD